MLSTIKSNALSLATIALMVLASAVYLTAGFAVTSDGGFAAGPNVSHAAAPTPPPKPSPSPTPCTPDDPKKPCPTPTPTESPTPSPTMVP